MSSCNLVHNSLQSAHVVLWCHSSPVSDRKWIEIETTSSSLAVNNPHQLYDKRLLNGNMYFALSFYISSGKCIRSKMFSKI
jgi:hypothetical protein